MEAEDWDEPKKNSIALLCMVGLGVGELVGSTIFARMQDTCGMTVTLGVLFIMTVIAGTLNIIYAVIFVFNIYLCIAMVFVSFDDVQTAVRLKPVEMPAARQGVNVPHNTLPQ